MTPPFELDAAELARLAEKYEAITALRRGRASGAPAASKETLQRLAARFPGALYELDTLELAEIERRATALREAASTGISEEWMGWMSRYHALVRADLAERRAARAAGPRPRATAMAIERIARDAATTVDVVERALFARRRRGLAR